MRKPKPQPEIKILQDSYASAQRNADSYRARNIQVEAELKLAQVKIAELERDKQWLKQLSQNLSESICTRERNR